MRRTNYLVIILLLISQITFGQIYQNMAQPGYKFGRARFDSVLTIPTGLGGLRNITSGQDTGQIRFNVSDSSVYVWNGRAWIKPVGGTDTTSLSNRINLKLNITDTIGTGSLYIRNLFTPQENKRFNVKSGHLDTLYASTSGGGRIVSNGGTIAAEWGAGGGSNFNFHGFAGYNLNRASSYTTRSFTDKNYVDSSIALKTTVTSYGKNAGGDSTILLLSNGTRYAAKDSVGGSAAGSNTQIQYNNAGAFDASSTFKYAPKGEVSSNKVYSALYVNPTILAEDNTDTLVALEIIPSFNSASRTGVITQSIKIGRNYLNFDSLYNFSIGAANAARPNDGNTFFVGQSAGLNASNAHNSNFLGANAGQGATNAEMSNFFGNDAGSGATNASYSNFLGANAGQDATDAGNSNFLGLDAGRQATNASNSNFFGFNAGYEAINASLSNFFGQSAGKDATNANNSNFFGQNAGQEATFASYSNFLGLNAGREATNAFQSNFFGSSAGISATNANESNFIGYEAGMEATDAYYSNFLGYGAGEEATNANNSNFFGFAAGNVSSNANNSNFFGSQAGKFATNASMSNFFGQSAGFGATGGSYSNFFGYNTGNSTTHSITGTNNILIGTNITTPTAAATNTANIGGVLYLTNTYGTTTGSPKATAQTAGKVGINTTTPVASAALEITSTTAGVLIPRMTTTQRDSIATPATGLQIYNTNTNAFNYYNGTAWTAIGGGGWGLSGNASAITDFLGTTNNRTMRFRTNNVERMVIDSTGKVGINTTTPAASAALEITSTNAGVLIPRMTLAQRNAIVTPAAGLEVIVTGETGGEFSSIYNSSTSTWQRNLLSTSSVITNVFVGNGAGSGATSATGSNFFGSNAGLNASSAASSNFFGTNAGSGATSASSSNFFGSNAGLSASAASSSNFFGDGAGVSATNALASNFFGSDAGSSATNATSSNFFGNTAGFGATGANNSNFFGFRAGRNATGASHSNFFGFNVGNSTTHTITGANNILIGTNITTPTAATANSANIGGVLYLTGTYGTTTGNPRALAQTAGKVGINTTTPVASAVLEITSTTAGVLFPRMTTGQKTAIASPVAGLVVYDTTLNKLCVYTTTWETITSL